MADKYLTTTQAAKICSVTRFTIANWVKAGKLESKKTAGGHRRILKEHLLRFINSSAAVRKSQSGVTYHIPRCWEFYFKSAGTHHCTKCLVFKERANKCFLLFREFGSEKIQCRHSCIDCDYLQKYYPRKERIVKQMSCQNSSGVPDINHKREDGVSTLVQKGLYVSGKYLASIKKVISRPKKTKGRCLPT